MSYDFPPQPEHLKFNQRVRASLTGMVDAAMRSLDSDFGPVPESVPRDAVREALTLFGAFTQPLFRRGVDYKEGMNGAQSFESYLYALPNEGTHADGRPDFDYPGRVLGVSMDCEETCDNNWLLATSPETSPFMVSADTFGLPQFVHNRLLQEASLSGLNYLREEHAEGRIARALVYEPTESDLEVIAEGLLLGGLVMEQMLTEMPEHLESLDPDVRAWFRRGGKP